MVSLYGRHFIYKDIPSMKYRLMFGVVEAEPHRRISGSKVGAFVTNKAMKQRYLVNDDYSSSEITFEVELVTCDGSAIDLESLREIERWLFANSVFSPLYFAREDDPFSETTELVDGIQKRLYMNCRFLDAEKLEYNGGVVGFKCIMETDGMLMWQEPISMASTLPREYKEGGETEQLLAGDVDFDGRVTLKDAMAIQWNAQLIEMMYPPEFDEKQMFVADIDRDGQVTLKDAMAAQRMFEADMNFYPVVKEYWYYNKETGETEYYMANYFDVMVDTDVDGYTYPVITLEIGNTGGDITIRNQSDGENGKDRYTSFVGLPPGITLEIDSRTHRVTEGCYTKMAKKYFPRLIDGMNHLIFTGDIVQCVVTWQNRRFM